MNEILRISVNNGLFAQEIIHGIVVIPFGFYLWKKFQKWELIALLYLVVYLIDVDHLIDFWSFYGINFDFKNMVALKFFKTKGFAYVFFHAWEWALILFVLSKKTKYKAFFLTMAIGVFIHILVDAINIKNVIFYSIVYRYLTHFKIVF